MTSLLLPSFFILKEAYKFLIAPFNVVVVVFFFVGKTDSLGTEHAVSL